VKPEGKRWKGRLFAPPRQAWYDAELEVVGYVLEITKSIGFSGDDPTSDQRDFTVPFGHFTAFFPFACLTHL
jgi:hypothetical protein